jgi:hypothetical protein
MLPWEELKASIRRQVGDIFPVYDIKSSHQGKLDLSTRSGLTAGLRLADGPTRAVARHGHVFTATFHPAGGLQE